MKALSTLLAICEGNPVDSPHKGPVMWKLTIDMANPPVMWLLEHRGPIIQNYDFFGGSLKKMLQTLHNSDEESETIQCQSWDFASEWKTINSGNGEIFHGVKCCCKFCSLRFIISSMVNSLRPGKCLTFHKNMLSYILLKYTLTPLPLQTGHLWSWWWLGACQATRHENELKTTQIYNVILHQ